MFILENERGSRKIIGENQKIKGLDEIQIEKKPAIKVRFTDGKYFALTYLRSEIMAGVAFDLLLSYAKSNKANPKVPVFTQLEFFQKRYYNEGAIPKINIRRRLDSFYFYDLDRLINDDTIRLLEAGLAPTIPYDDLLCTLIYLDMANESGPIPKEFIWAKFLNNLKQ